MAPQPGTPRTLRSFYPHGTSIISLFLVHGTCMFSVLCCKGGDHSLSLGFSEQK